MRAVIENVLHFAPELYFARVFFDADYTRELYASLDFDSFEVTKLEKQADGTVLRHARAFPPVHAPGFVKRLLGPAVSYIEEGTLDPASGRWRFRNFPSVAADHARIQGEIHLEPHPAGARHIVELDLEVTAFGLGSLIEKLIVNQSRDSFAHTVRFTDEYVRRKQLERA